MPVDENTPGYGTSDWEVDAEQLSTLTSDEIATAFGLDATEYGQYFSSFDGWKGEFANDEYENTKDALTNRNTLDNAKFDIAAQSLNNQGVQAGEDLGSTLESNIMQLSDAYGDSMAQSIDAQANNLMGGASLRGKKTMGNRMSESSEMAGDSANTAYGRSLDALSIEAQNLNADKEFTSSKFETDLESAGQTRDFDIMAEKQQFKKEQFDVLGDLASTGVLDEEGYGSNDWINEITKLDDHWKAADFSDYKNNLGFLEWFRDNQASVDRDWNRGSGSEVTTAFKEYESGKAAGETGGTYCCTAGMRTGYMSRYKTSKLKIWHNSQSDVWRLGYDVWGKFIANNLVDKYKWAGECTEKFYQWHCNGKKSFKGLIAILFIKPISYLIGGYKKLIRSYHGN